MRNFSCSIPVQHCNMTSDLILNIVKDHLVPAGDYIYGFARLAGLLPANFSDYPCGISIGRKLDDGILDGVRDAPTLAYYHHYTDVNRQLQAVTEKIAGDLNGAGIGAVAIKPTITADPQEFDRIMPTLRYDVSHKMVATRAGLGWIGKTDLFISPVFGARLRLASILTSNGPGPERTPVDKSRCGSCNLCADRCPAKAATGQPWDITLDRDVFFDAYKCREMCGELARVHLNMALRICGICVAVCPIGRKNII
jgi:epoxyqueuosine reductase